MGVVINVLDIYSFLNCVLSLFSFNWEENLIFVFLLVYRGHNQLELQEGQCLVYQLHHQLLLPNPNANLYESIPYPSFIHLSEFEGNY